MRNNILESGRVLMRSLTRAILFGIVSLAVLDADAQTFTTNRTPVGMEHNVLFNAVQNFTVSQTGAAALHLPTLFDGVFAPSYTYPGPTISSPTVVLIEGLPNIHVQVGGWVGWSTRYWPPNRFKIEGYDEYAGINIWRTIADYSSQDYSGSSFIATCPSGAYTKLKFTFYSATGTNGSLGISELFFIHPEAVVPYQNLSPWRQSGADLFRGTGNVGIGTSSASHKLTVNGPIRAKEVIVDTGWSDYVFAPGYELQSLSEVEAHIKEHQHLPGIPSASEVAEQGVSVGEMQAKLLAKIEELTLHMIKLQKQVSAQSARIQLLEAENASLHQRP